MTTFAFAVSSSVPRSLRWTCAVVLFVAISAFVLVRVPLVSVPLERDEGEYAYIAQRLLEGDVPYRDAFDQKPPGTFFVYAAALSLLGPSVEGIHLFLHAWTAATALALFGCVRRREGPLAAAFAVLLFSVLSANPKLTGNAANTELFMLLPMVASVYCLLRALGSPMQPWWWIVTGALAAAACWFKQVAVTNALFLAAVAAWHFGRPSTRDIAALARAWAGLVVGALLVSAPVLLGFAAAGAWRPFVDAVFWHNFRYAQSVGPAQGFEMLVYRLSEQAPSMAVCWALAALALFVLRRTRGSKRGFWLGWWIASAVGVSVGFFFRPHYFFQALPALVVLAGCVLGATAERLLARGGTVAGVGIAALIAVAVLPPIIANRTILAARDPNEISRAIYGMNPFPESVEIGRYIRRTSDPDDRVYIVGSEPQILFYSERASATRYIFFYPLTGSYPGVLERQHEVMAEVAATRPRYVVWVNLRSSLLRSDETEPHVFDASRELLDREYGLELLAFPAPEGDSYDFVYGREALELMSAAGERAESAPWVALYRRRG
ncbi:MAG: glycosyltransferase family 39 protein [Deltaproteobacteria bacterium]|nr:glycosyltransferase family 39 protein [Deltaproteobacteria bacterium]MBW2666356.1 glycosyltransferase family 39 protein [Deltaproteobacteria bacterium]